MTASAPTTLGRRRLRGNHALRMGLFGPNCSSGRYITSLPNAGRRAGKTTCAWRSSPTRPGSTSSCRSAAGKATAATAITAGRSYETITWATGLLAATKRITCFGTVHVPLFHPLIAAKQMVTADHVGEGRFGLNIVCGWNEGEFAMFGRRRERPRRPLRPGSRVDRRRDPRWSEDDFDFTGTYYDLRGVREKPKPYGGTRPILMNAGRSPKAGRSRCATATRSSRSRATPDSIRPGSRRRRSSCNRRARWPPRSAATIDLYTVGYVCCKPTLAQAKEYLRYIVEENADWKAVDNIMAMRGLLDGLSPEEAERRAGAGPATAAASRSGAIPTTSPSSSPRSAGSATRGSR